MIAHVSSLTVMVWSRFGVCIPRDHHASFDPTRISGTLGYHVRGGLSTLRSRRLHIFPCYSPNLITSEKVLETLKRHVWQNAE